MEPMGVQYAAILQFVIQSTVLRFLNTCTENAEFGIVAYLESFIRILIAVVDQGNLL